MTAEELNMEKWEDLKRQVKSLALDEKQRNKFITEEWRRMREAEERRITAEAEAEERRLAAQAEERWIAAEAEEQRVAAQAEERRIAAEERKAELEVEKLRLELEARKLSQSLSGEQINQESFKNVVRKPPLPSFVDGKDNLDEYCLKFQRYADVAKRNRSTRATQLSPLLTGKAVEVCNRLSPEEAMNYERLKVALLEKYNFTERGYARNFEELGWKDKKAQVNLYLG